MKTIWKLPLLITDEQNLHMPVGSTILDVQAQGEQIIAWALVDTEAEPSYRRIAIFGDGHQIPSDAVSTEDKIIRRYLATVQMPDGLVWHVFMLP